MPDVSLPKPTTIKKYGLSLNEWLSILESQGNVCAICRKLPSTGRLCVEHEHVKGWKKMPPEQRKQYVRGICCFGCNTQYLGRGLNVSKAANVLAYMTAYEARRPRL